MPHIDLDVVLCNVNYMFRMCLNPTVLAADVCKCEFVSFLKLTIELAITVCPDSLTKLNLQSTKNCWMKETQ